MFKNLFGNHYVTTETVDGVSCEIRVSFAGFSQGYTAEIFATDLKVAQAIYAGTEPVDLKDYLQQVKHLEIIRLSDAAAFQTIAGSLEYKEFKHVSARLLTQLVLSLFRSELKKVLSEGAQGKLTLAINVVNRYKADELTAFVYDPKAPPGRLDLEVSGQLLFGRLYLPWRATRRADTAMITGLLVHEFQHLNQVRRGGWDAEDLVEARVQQVLDKDPRRWRGSVQIIVGIMMNLYTEGEAQLARSRNSRTVTVDLPKILTLRKLLEQIAAAPDEETATRIFEDEFRAKADINTGDWYLGFLMAYTIGLSRLQPKRHWGVMVSSGAWLIKHNPTIPFAQLGDYLLQHHRVQIEQLDEQTLIETLNELREIKSYLGFIQRYVQACNSLGFKPALRVFDFEFYNHLKKLYQTQNPMK